MIIAVMYSTPMPRCCLACSFYVLVFLAAARTCVQSLPKILHFPVYRFFF